MNRLILTFNRLNLEHAAEKISSDLPKELRVPRNLYLDNVIGQVQRGVSTKRSLNVYCEHMAFVFQLDPNL